ncbi:hypothetical protein KC318_g1034 [Hortaea werneckii]|nr:hypothetical protein KC334_g502 [Hortaea werneckii]KAI7013714.1 hypothetical protein KC355_g4937 [Hortaea werneckii]KAI7202301.1 hypothetical protein KC324_g1808 [Hortaea werneckii]KAI7594249.1 hypothetical protein KC316_g1231 [Hortaea werneckii]KAI7675322.1 hypothetical protein KC318_g1034 [Hortaea werneckii]
MTSTITHIVLFKYRPEITWSAFEAHFDTFQSLQTKCLHPDTGKPYMLSMRMGKNRSWEPFSKGMTHAFVLEFASQEHLDYYLLHDPVHREFSRNAGPLIEDSLVVDIRDGVLFGPKAKRPLGSGEYRGKKEVMPEKVIVRTLLLDGGSDMPATGEIFPEGKLAWVRDLKESMPNGV